MCLGSSAADAHVKFQGNTIFLIPNLKSTLVQVMAWCHQATSHYLSQCWPRSMPPYGFTRPQWVNFIVGARECCLFCTKPLNSMWTYYAVLVIIAKQVLTSEQDGFKMWNELIFLHHDFLILVHIWSVYLRMISSDLHELGSVPCEHVRLHFYKHNKIMSCTLGVKHLLLLLNSLWPRDAYRGIKGLMGDCGISCVLQVEIPQSCTNPSVGLSELCHYWCR